MPPYAAQIERALHQFLREHPGGDGSGDVVGPGGATSDHLTVFDGTTGRLLKDGGPNFGLDLVRTGAGTLKLSGSASAAFGVQNGENDEYGAIGWDGADSFVIGTQGGVNGGTARDVIVGAADGKRVILATDATSRWATEPTTGALRPWADDTYDLGTGTDRVRSLYLAEYLNFSDTEGADGFGLRNNAGTIEAKNEGGEWAALGGGGSAFPNIAAPVIDSVTPGTDGSLAAGTYYIKVVPFDLVGNVGPESNEVSAVIPPEDDGNGSLSLAIVYTVGATGFWVGFGTASDGQDHLQQIPSPRDGNDETHVITDLGSADTWPPTSSTPGVQAGLAGGAFFTETLDAGTVKALRYVSPSDTLILGLPGAPTNSQTVRPAPATDGYTGNGSSIQLQASDGAGEGNFGGDVVLSPGNAGTDAAGVVGLNGALYSNDDILVLGRPGAPTADQTIQPAASTDGSGSNLSFAALNGGALTFNAALPTINATSIGAPVLAGDGAGNVDNGTHHYKFTLYDYLSEGETALGTASDAVVVADKTVDGKVRIPIPRLYGSPTEVIKLYRDADDGVYKLVATLDTDVPGDYIDNIADAALGAVGPTTNTTQAERVRIVGNRLTTPFSPWWPDGNEALGLGAYGTSVFRLIGAPGIAVPTKTDGMWLFISAGDGFGTTGHGGDLHLDPGANAYDTALNGAVYINNDVLTVGVQAVTSTKPITAPSFIGPVVLPTADPHIVGALWNNSNAFAISAG